MMAKKISNQQRSFTFEIAALPQSNDAGPSPKKDRAKPAKDSQGKRANKTGKTAEATIFCTIQKLGYYVEEQYCIGLGVYDHPVFVDLFIKGIDAFPDGLIIESKWQQSPGSVDEKFLYLEANIKYYYPCPAIIVYGGGGAKNGAIDYLRRGVDGEKLIGVFTFEELLKWINNNL